MNQKKYALIFVSGMLLTGITHAAPLADGASKFMGNITTNGQVRSDFGTYWNQITAENECKWASIEGRAQGSRDFTGCDRAYQWAKDNGGTFKFHALVWGSQYPSWLKNLSVEDTRKAIEDWFDAVAKQYPDMPMIDVVNEAIRTGTNRYHSPYHETKIIEALGGDNNNSYQFVATAFKMARERWPKAILIYNDYNTIRWNINQGIDLIKKIKALGAPVDAYGQQAHDVTDMNVDDFKAALERIHSETQLPLFITEYDIGTNDDAYQLQRYKEQISIMMDAPYVAGITLWGYIFGATWLDEKDANGNVITRGWSGIIKNGVDRPAMTWLKEYMATNKGVNTTGLNVWFTPVEPDTVPQVPYTEAIAIPGVIEAENYDVGGQNQSYYDSDVDNQGEAYRQDQVDIVTIPTGHAVGYTMAGEWLEYSVNIASPGVYQFEANVASGLDGSSFQLFIDDKNITDTIQVPNGGDWTTYTLVTGTTSELAAGSHILKLAITGSYANIDNISLTPQTTTIKTPIHALQNPIIQEYKVYNINGTYLHSFNTQSLAELKNQMRSSHLKKGVYLVKSRISNAQLIPID